MSSYGHLKSKLAGLSNGTSKSTNMSQFDIHAVDISFSFFHAINFASGIPYEYRFPSYLDRKYILKSTFFIYLPWVSRWQSSLN